MPATVDIQRFREDYVTPEQAASLTTKSARTWRRWAADGKVFSMSGERGYLIPKHTVQRYIDENTPEQQCRKLINDYINGAQGDIHSGDYSKAIAQSLVVIAYELEKLRQVIVK